jgi:hypothetical protein
MIPSRQEVPRRWWIGGHDAVEAPLGGCHVRSGADRACGFSDRHGAAAGLESRAMRSTTKGRLRIPLDDHLSRRLEVQARRRYLPLAAVARMFIAERLCMLELEARVRSGLRRSRRTGSRSRGKPSPSTR